VIVIAVSVALAACGGDDGESSGADPVGTTVPAPAVPEDAPTVPAELEAGREAFFGQGCPGCHRVGAAGSNLARDLTTVGAELSRAELEGALRGGPSFMPSYDAMPPPIAKRLLDYLEALR
jgi:mono/diheme cytochrome c family protein